MTGIEKAFLGFIWSKPWLILGLALLTLWVVDGRVFQAAQLRGWIGGRQIVQRPITGLDISTSMSRRGERVHFHVYWQENGKEQTTNIEQSDWVKLRKGQMTDFVKLPGDPHLYLKDLEIMTSGWSLLLDVVLNLVALGFAGHSVSRMLGARKQQPGTA